MVVVGVAEGDDVAGDAAARGPDDRRVGVVDDDGVLAAQANAGPSVPGELHATDCRAGHSPRTAGRRAIPDTTKEPEAPAQSAPPVRGREDGTEGVFRDEP